MHLRLLVITALVAGAAIVAALFAQSLFSISAQAQTRPRYLAENTASGDLIFPKNFHASWELPIPKQPALAQ